MNAIDLVREIAYGAYIYHNECYAQHMNDIVNSLAESHSAARVRNDKTSAAFLLSMMQAIKTYYDLDEHCEVTAESRAAIEALHTSRQ